MLTFALAVFCFPQSSSQDVSWQEVRSALPAEQQEGFDFLLKHMPLEDRQQLSPAWLVSELRAAYEVWQGVPWRAEIPLEIFLNEVLPYASVNERRDAWRAEFARRFVPLVQDAKSPSEAAAILNQEIFPLLKVKYSTERPKADQSPFESIAAGMASCTGLSILLVDACRAVGVPARFVGTPLWADGSGNHSWVEIWDDGWHYTGAAEPTGDVLDRAWFSQRAAQAVAEDPERAIYAVSYRQTPRSFPLVWAPQLDWVHAVNVTHRYTQARGVSEGEMRLRISALDSGGKRQLAKVRLHSESGSLLAEGQTRDESFDANDHFTVSLPAISWVEVQVETEDAVLRKSLQITADETLLSFLFGKNSRVETTTPQNRLWDDHVRQIRRARAEEWKERVLHLGDKEMPFWFRTFGEKPEGGRSLWISLHGGGGTQPQVNDQQWQNQKRLYSLEEGVYLAPRAPTNTWNLWHQGHIDAFFDRLIQNMIVFEDVNPDRVYVLGYSAGGDGVYQLAPRMADRWAAAGMMAGHPNETKADGLRNLPFTLHMGAEDAAYDRNKVAAQWQENLAKLRSADLGGYRHWVEIHPGLGHWMDRKDAAALPWMAKHTRNLRPEKVVWLQDDVTHLRYYWLAVEKANARSRLVVSREGNVFVVEDAQGLDSFLLRLDASMVDFSEDITVSWEDSILFQGRLEPSHSVMRRTLRERGDPRGIFSAEIPIRLP